MNKVVILLFAVFLCCTSFASGSGERRIGITSSEAASHLLSKPAAVYPAIAKAARIQGTVTIDVTVNEKGLVTGQTIVSGPPMLQQSAMEAVKNYRYKPFLHGTTPVVAEFHVMVVYSLSS